MNQNDIRSYEAAFSLCLGEIEKGTDSEDAINKIKQNSRKLYLQIIRRMNVHAQN